MYLICPWVAVFFTCGGARRSVSGTFSSFFLKTSQNSHLKASNNESRGVWKENLEFLRWSAVNLLFQISHLEASNTEYDHSRHVWRLFVSA